MSEVDERGGEAKVRVKTQSGKKWRRGVVFIEGKTMLAQRRQPSSWLLASTMSDNGKLIKRGMLLAELNSTQDWVNFSGATAP